MLARRRAEKFPFSSTERIPKPNKTRTSIFHFRDRTNPETEQTPNIDFRFLIILLCKPNRTRRKINRNIFHFVLTKWLHADIFSI